MVPGCSARLYLCFKNYMFVLRGIDWSFAGGDSFQFVVWAQALEADLGSVLTSVVTSVISRWAYHTSLSLAFLFCQKGANSLYSEAARKRCLLWGAGPTCGTWHCPVMFHSFFPPSPAQAIWGFPRALGMLGPGHEARSLGPA